MRPLAAFSMYLSGRNDLLLALGREILELLDTPEQTGALERRSRASDRMWLWTLGAYEVTRTMCQSRLCFSDRFFAAVSGLKNDLERVRVPNTKMERIQYDRRQAPIAVTSTRAPHEWDDASNDLLIGDPLDLFSSRALLAAYADVMGSLTPDDVRMSHEESLRRT